MNLKKYQIMIMLGLCFFLACCFSIYMGFHYKALEKKHETVVTKCSFLIQEHISLLNEFQRQIIYYEGLKYGYKRNLDSEEEIIGAVTVSPKCNMLTWGKISEIRVVNDTVYCCGWSCGWLPCEYNESVVIERHNKTLEELCPELIDWRIASESQG